LQLQQITAAGTEKALLASVTEAHPDASYIELLRLFKVRSRRWALVARMLHLCLLRVVRTHLICSQLPHLTVTFAARICTATAHSLPLWW
jgi:hypothetical protein